MYSTSTLSSDRSKSKGKKRFVGIIFTRLLQLALTSTYGTTYRVRSFLHELLSGFGFTCGDGR